MTDQVLTNAESELTASLTREHASPFIAHHAVSEAETVRLAIRSLVGNTLEQVWELFRRYPRVVVWLIADTLAMNYGEGGGHACYEHIEQALGLTYSLNNNDRTRLHRKFRLAALRLGLSLPPASGQVGRYSFNAVDDYFAQAGIALSQVDHLAEMLRKGQGAFGVPEADSTESLAQWEADTVDRFTPQPLRRLPKVLLADTTGYHAGLFARLETGDQPGTPFGRALERALERIERPERQFVARVAFVDGELQVRDGQGETGFEAELNFRTVRVRRGESVVLPTPWPETITCQAMIRGSAKLQTITLLPPDVLAMVFDAATGRLVRSIKRDDQHVQVRRGEAAIVSRHPFAIGGESAIQVDAAAYLVYRDLLVEDTLTVDGQAVTLKPQSRASVRLQDGQVVAWDAGMPLRAGSNKVFVDFPGARELVQSGALELRLRHPALPEGAAAVLCPLPDVNDTMVVDLTDVLPRSGAFGLLFIDLYQLGNNRRLARERIWLWPGLTAFPNGERFLAPSIPGNWDKKRSMHVHVDTDGQLALKPPGDTPYEAARLVINSPNDRTGDLEPLATFLIPPPGVSMVLREADGSSRPLKAGQVLALSPRDGSTLVIRTPDHQAQLDIKGLIGNPSFSKGRRDLPALVLHSSVPTGEGHSEIRYRTGEPLARWETLVRLVDVADVAGIVLDESEHDSTVVLSLGRIPLDVRLTVEGIGNGFQGTFVGEPALLVNRLESTNEVQVVLRKRVLPYPGVYLVRMEVAFISGRWQELTNARRDWFEWAIVKGTHPVSGIAPGTEGDVLAQLTPIVGRCLDQTCWDRGIKRHVLPLWKNSVAALRRRNPPDYATGLGSAHAAWDTSRTSTWMPIHHPLEHFTDLYAAPLSSFRVLATDESAPGTHMLAELAAFAEVHSLPELFSVEGLTIEPRFLAGFQNAAAVNRGLEAPKGFAFSRFEQALATTPIRERGSLWTRRQPRLTAEHHAWCCEQAVARLFQAYSRGFNARRTPSLALLAYASTAHMDLPGLPPQLDAGCLGMPTALQEGLSQTEVALIKFLPDLVSNVACHSIAHRLDEFAFRLGHGARMPRQQVLEHLGFLTRLAPELLAFYLLLWHLASFGATTNA